MTEPVITERSVDVLIVGAGPAGLSAGAELARTGAGTVEIIERERVAGGIPRHSHHTGYGLRDLHRVLTGPAYARHYAEAARAAGARIRTGVTVTGWASPLTVTTTGPGGLERISARAVLLATGARERPRSARLVPGDRPAGVYTTGELQQAVHLRHQPVGRRAVVVGTEHVAYSAALTLRHAGVEVRALLTGLPRQESYAAFRHALRLAYAIPVLTGHTVTAIHGRDRVTGIAVRRPAGTESVIACDTVVFTGDWIPDHELARRAGLTLDPGTRGPAVTAAMSTTHPGVFAAGNLVHPVETADNAALTARFAARAVLAHLAAPTASPADGAVPVRGSGAVRWAFPNLLHPDARPYRDRLVLWASAVTRHPRVEIRQDGRLLYGTRPHRPLIPGRPYYVPSHWLPAIEPYGAPVEIAAFSTARP